MTEYEKFVIDNGRTPEAHLQQLKSERALYQRSIDDLIVRLHKINEKKNSYHYEINKLKRIIKTK